MPTHVYQPPHSPPTHWDRVLVHPLETVVAGLSFAFGVIVLLGLTVPGFTPSTSLREMPLAISVLEGVFMVAGGVLASIGLQWSGDDVSTGWALERFGWLLAGAGFLTYSISVSWHFPASTLAWVVPGCLGLAALLRCWVLVLIERRTRRTIAEVTGMPLGE